jgi:hypothetical protein
MWGPLEMLFGGNSDVAAKDSLGTFLKEKELITEEQLQKALDFINDNPDTMLGEALVKLNILDRGIMETMLAENLVGRGTRRDLAKVIDLTEAQHRRIRSEHADRRTEMELCTDKMLKDG